MRKPRLLLIDDDLGVLKALTAVLRSLGYQVSPFDDPMAALLSLESESVDLILSDIRMDPIDGYKFMELARSTACQAPIILMSGHVRGASLPGVKPGPDGFIPKPFTPEVLKNYLAKFNVAGPTRAAG